MRTPASKHARVLILTALIGATAGVAPGAKPSSFKAPVARFRDASAVVINATKLYLAELNKVERDQYIYSQAAARRPILLNQIERVQVFSKAGIAARLDALNQIADYTDLLDQLANSDAPGAIKAKAADLQTATSNLADQVSTLTGEDDKQFKNAAAGVLPIIGDILSAFANKAIEDALKKAITVGTDPLNKLIDAIEIDTRVAFQRKRNGYSGARVMLVDQYNREYLKGDQADSVRLKSFADQISAEEDRWEAFMTAQPMEGLEAMKRANDALLKFAKTPKPGITDFESFVDAMESFTETARRIGAAIQGVTGK